MEKIQAAIEKARAQRAGQDPGPGPGVRTPHEAAAPPTPGTDAAWAALSALRVDPARMAAHRIVAFQGGREAVAFDVMRTRVLQQMRANNWRRLAITSPTPGCGKSTIALNLGFSFARQPEIRTILAELDLRRPSLAGTLGIKGRTSLSQVLDGRADFADVAVCHGGNLALATNQGPARNPAELLHGPNVPAALAAIEALYQPDIMLFDMPPMLVSDDTMAFAGQVDAVLLIAGAEATTIKEIDICERELATQTNVMGVVLNKCRFMGPDYGYGYGY
jgi:protein-tyrosine kinase